MSMPLVEITPEIHQVLLDIRYATPWNFTEKPAYSRPACFLHPQAETCLMRAVRLAAQQGYRLKIFDAYRPTEVQQLFWDYRPDPEFLADPKRGSPHSRGVAVDLTLCDANGTELNMGTEFDRFDPLSHHGNTEISPAAQKNRFILLGIMSSAGWDFYKNEWWHYQLFSSRDYPLLSDAQAGTDMLIPGGHESGEGS